MTPLRGGRIAAALVAALLAGACGEPEDPHGAVACAGCHRGAAADSGRAAVVAASCDRGGCHAGVEAPSDSARMAMVVFRHRSHGADSGAAVQCASCHTHRPDDAAIVADTTACALCHAQGITAARGGADCLTCHPSPRHTSLTSQGVPITHATLEDARVPCTRCHYELLDGRADAASGGCAACHGDTRSTGPVLALLDSLRAARPASLRLDPTAAGRIAAGRRRVAALADTLHVTHTGYSCESCHDEVRHRVVAMSTSVALACGDCHATTHRRPIPEDTIPGSQCRTCHEGVHAEEQRLILGLLPDEPIRPSPMFMGGVTCRSCHIQPGAPPLRPGQSLVSTDAACVGCHGIQWGGYLAMWKRGWHRRETMALRYVEGARGAVADSALAPPEARSLVRRAASLLAFLRGAGPLHNLPASDRIMRDALGLAERAFVLAGRPGPPLPELGPPVETGTCMSCHYGIEEVAADRDTVTGRQFTHGNHMVRGGLACDNCHAAGAPPPGIPDSLWIDTTRTDRGPRRRN